MSAAPAFFEQLYRDDIDPWGSTSPYERAKYQATLAACGPGRSPRLELGARSGCSRPRCAPRCRALLALDGAPTAVAGRASGLPVPHVT